MAASAAPLETRMALPSGALPVGEVMKPPAAITRSKALRSTMRSRITGKAARAERLDDDDLAVAEMAHGAAGSRGPGCGPWEMPLITTPHDPQIPSRQSWSKVIGAWPATPGVR